ncbi:MAG: hypothetical protein MO846_06115 [Candidatus Devosia symbiotica]|nr:hypothetical protein [Candidatus Devosia symbiotica]
MADYKELLRRAISALPENNGAARRAVYEKARSALVGQLRSISPPLPAHDITQYRLQLEDCIRQVEQEASEAVITLGREGAPTARAFKPEPVDVKPIEPKPDEPSPAEKKTSEQSVLAETPDEPAEAATKSTAGMSIEEIIAEAASISSASVIQVPVVSQPTAKSESAVLLPRAELPRSTPMSPVSNVRPLETPVKPAAHGARYEPAASAANSTAELGHGGRVEPSLGEAQATLRRVVEPALSSVREVELETVEPDASEARGAIEQAVETLDREARGESSADEPKTVQAIADRMFAAPGQEADEDDSGFASAPVAPRTSSGLTIFLVVFAILLVGVSGAGFWAWREGFVDLDQMFGQSQPAVAQNTDVAAPSTPTLDPVQATETVIDPVAAPGNTAPVAATESATTLEGLEVSGDRLAATLQTPPVTGTDIALSALGSADGKSEERLPGRDINTIAANDPSASVDPTVLAGSQSLLLEASPSGTTGAVPFSGTVEWHEDVDELGQPTLIGHASIPARNLGVDLTIRKNSDPSLPASHLMEVDFHVSDTFIGGTVANLPGILLKNEELVPGTPLVGASARVVGNSFLFALSASPSDVATNTDLLENQKWMDLAVVYGTGHSAIITLEKDEAAQALFEKVFGAWAQ